MGECLVFRSLNGGDDSPLIPEGKYEMSYVSHTTWRFMGKQPKVVIYFSIVDPGYIGVIVPAYYNVISTTGKPGKNGRFKTAKKSNLVRDFYSIFPNESPSRFDRLPLTNLKNVIVHGTVKTVKTGFDQRTIPEPIQYSVVRRIEPCC